MTLMTNHHRQLSIENLIYLHRPICYKNIYKVIQIQHIEEKSLEKIFKLTYVQGISNAIKQIKNFISKYNFFIYCWQ